MKSEYDIPRTTAQKLMCASRILERGIKDRYYAIISIYSRNISDYEIILDEDVNNLRGVITRNFV